MFNLIKNIIIKFFKLLGFEIYRHRQVIAQTSRASMYSCLSHACQNGLQPKAIIDVGAASGTPALYEVFTQARHILIEPLEEYIPHLNSLVDNLEQAEYIIAAATAKPGNLVINVHPDLVGSSLYKEDENSNVNGVERTIPAMTLDNICSEQGTKGPYLIKLIHKARS